MIGDKISCYLYYTKVIYPYANPLNLQNNNICQTNTQHIKQQQKDGATN